MQIYPWRRTRIGCVRIMYQVLFNPAIRATTNFELKGHILAQLKDIPFYGKDHKDTYKHIDEVNEIAEYFNIPNVPRKTVQLMMLPVAFKGTTNDWLKALPPVSITTWPNMHGEFIQQF